MVHNWELDIVKDWTIEEIKNKIWMAVDLGQPIPGCVSVEALRQELINRGEKPIGYHNA